MNYLASPPLVVAYALAGTMDLDITTEPLGTGSDGKPVFLADIWPSAKEIDEVIASAIGATGVQRGLRRRLRRRRAVAVAAHPEGQHLRVGRRLDLRAQAPVLRGHVSASRTPVTDIAGARVLAKLGDSVTTDHISPASSIKADSPAGKYLAEHGVPRHEFNSYGSRRGNHEVMIRGTFANIRLRNQLVPGRRGRLHRQPPDRRADQHLRRLGGLPGGRRPAGRSWPARSTAPARRATGRPRAPCCWACARSSPSRYERIHRSNLIGMGVLPLQFPPKTRPPSRWASPAPRRSPSPA